MQKYSELIGAVLLILAIYIGYNFNLYRESVPEELPVEEETIEDVIQEANLLYDIPVDEYQVEKGKIRKNENLSEILSRYHLDYSQIHKLVNKSKEVFDVRNLRAGKNYTVFCTQDSVKKARCFIYEPNKVEYVVFDLRDSINIYRGEKEVVTKTRTAAGIIRSSLYETLDEAGASPYLAVKLADIYAWSIDFYRIQKEDKFKVVYEENYVDGEPVGVGRIKAALFQHRGEDFYSFYFEEDDRGSYFDENANSLRKAFLKAPVKYSRISSRYTMNRYHPVQKRNKPHLGTDYAAPTGTPIMSVGDGTVLEATFSKYNGNYVKVRHNSTYTTQYLHMSKIASGMRPGKRVRQGDVIGYVGSTGLATGPHVCYRFWKNGSQVDPFKEKIPPSKPVKKEYMNQYKAAMKDMKNELERIEYNDKVLAEIL